MFFCSELLMAYGLACAAQPVAPPLRPLETQLEAQGGAVANCRNVSVSTRLWHSPPRTFERSGTLYSAPVITLAGTGPDGQRFTLRHVLGFNGERVWSMAEVERGQGEVGIEARGDNPELNTRLSKILFTYARSNAGVVTDLRDGAGHSLCTTPVTESK